MNNAVGFGFMVVFLLATIILVIASQVHYRNNLKRTYQRLAERFEGKCNSFGLWDQPSLNFVFRSAYAVLEIRSTGGQDVKHYTQLRISWPDIRFRCEVYPEGVLSRVSKFFGMGDIEIGSPRFDADYVISGSDAGELRAFLTPAVQDSINTLRSFGHASDSFRLDGTYPAARAGDVYLGVSGGQLLIKKRGLLREYDDLEKFVLLGLDLYDQAKKSSAEGIAFVDANAEAKLSLEGAVCQICGELVNLDAVFCRTCKTPHHKDCWDYYGACSTYGCGQRRYLVQRHKAISRS